MTDTFYTDDFAFSARILGAMFYYPPESEQTQALIAAFRQGEWQTQWPLAPEALAPLVPLFCAESKETIPEAWQRLFIGPWALPAPPWGSVWLDKESVLLATPRWNFASGCVTTTSSGRPARMSRKIILAPC
jgi:TorA maturation chaperone TorD